MKGESHGLAAFTAENFVDVLHDSGLAVAAAGAHQFRFETALVSPGPGNKSEDAIPGDNGQGQAEKNRRQPQFGSRVRLTRFTGDDDILVHEDSFGRVASSRPGRLLILNFVPASVAYAPATSPRGFAGFADGSQARRIDTADFRAGNPGKCRWRRGVPGLGRRRFRLRFLLLPGRLQKKFGLGHNIDGIGRPLKNSRQRPQGFANISQGIDIGEQNGDLTGRTHLPNAMGNLEIRQPGIFESEHHQIRPPAAFEIAQDFLVRST